jgi:hypothetical protein
MTKSMRWLALGAAAVALGACSDNAVTTAPTFSPAGASFSATLNGNSFTLASDALGANPTQYCPNAQVDGVFNAFPASQGALAGCITARDLQADGSLAAYNPGWDNPNGLTVTTGHWVGFTAGTGPSSDYRPTPGLYFFQQTFTLPTGVTAPSLTLDVLADNVAAVYLNGTNLGQQAMTDCNTAPCNWQVVNKLTVTAASGLFNAPGTANTLVFIVNDVPTGFPSTTAGVGGTPTNYGCTTRAFQAFGSTGFPAGQDNVATSSGHVGPHPTGEAAGILPLPVLNTPNPGQDGCENPSGLAFAGTVSWTPAPPPSTLWCSPGFWKNQGFGLWAPAHDLLYNNLITWPNAPQSFANPATPPKKGGSTNPTLAQVISNPSQYGGPATNNVADYISNKLFGTPIGVETENCPDASKIPPFPII